MKRSTWPTWQWNASGTRSGHQLDAFLDRRGKRLLDEDRQAAGDCGKRKRGVRRRGNGDHDRIDVGLVDHGQRIRKAGRPGLRDRIADEGRFRVRDRGQDAATTRREMAHVVAAHRAQSGEPDAEGCGHCLIPVLVAAGCVGVATSRIASITRSSSSGARFGRTGMDRTSSAMRFVTGRSRSAAFGTNAWR